MKSYPRIRFKTVNAGLNHDNEKLIMEWKGVQISGPENADFAQGLDIKLSEGKKVFPVRSEWHETTQNLRYANDKIVRDRIAYSYFYQDDFGNWAFTFYADPGQMNR